MSPYCTFTCWSSPCVRVNSILWRLWAVHRNRRWKINWFTQFTSFEIRELSWTMFTRTHGELLRREYKNVYSRAKSSPCVYVYRAIFHRVYPPLGRVHTVKYLSIHVHRLFTWTWTIHRNTRWIAEISSIHRLTKLASVSSECVH